MYRLIPEWNFSVLKRMADENNYRYVGFIQKFHLIAMKNTKIAGTKYGGELKNQTFVIRISFRIVQFPHQT